MAVSVTEFILLIARGSSEFLQRPTRMPEQSRKEAENYRIKRIDFSLLRPEDLVRMSVAEINTKTLYDIDSRKPTPTGPLDLRLGVSTKAGTCQTCGDALLNCPGHFGHVKLALPVYHVGLFRHTIAILNCICKSCAALLLPQNKKLHLLSRSVPLNIDAVKDECKKIKICSNCQEQNGTVKKNTGFRIYHEIKTPKEHKTVELNPLTCLNLFQMVKEEDFPFLGLTASPSSLIIQCLPVPPSCIRPSVDMHEEGFNEDDLTVKISEIINSNDILSESIRKGNSLPIINDDWDMLQLQVSLFINSDLPSINTQATPIRGLVQRMKGKTGRFRCNLSGKRVDFSGRTVISPDPNLSVEEVGVPVKIAKILTIPEKVTEFNKNRLQKLVANGVKYPGANFVVKKDKNGVEFKKFLLYAKETELSVGDTVERHLLDGDVLLFNRQPSLHRMSIMAHYTKIHKHRTLRFNECVCAPYNADFDGDEMNIHVPQTISSRVEAQELMAVKHNMCTPRNGEPLIACTQDFITGAFLITSRDVLMTRDRFAQLAAYILHSSSFRISIQPVLISPVELFTGKQLFDLIISYSLSSFPGSFVELKAKNRSFKTEVHPNDGYVLIMRNKLLAGRIDKSVIGGENRKNSLVYQILRVSKDAAVKALNSISKLTVRFLSERGFSVGFEDVIPSKELMTSKNQLVTEKYNEVYEEIEKGNANMEEKVSGILSQIREECGSICIQNLSRLNSLIVMQECGSKGSKINVSQMNACVGQQMVSGHRILDEMVDRTLPHFAPGSLTPESKGFVLNSFFSGLNSYEFFFHAASGRVGLVDTAVKTAETGYMQRRLMKALEDLSVQYDYSVRNSFNDTIQIEYGEDGIEPLRDVGDEFYEWIFRESVSIFSSKLTSLNVNDNIKKDGYLYLEGKIKLKRLKFNEKQRSMLRDFVVAKAGESFYYFGGFYSYMENIVFLDIFAEVTVRELMKMGVDPGAAVGAVAGQSIGEPTTQMTLETFHFAGVASANITLGVPRIKEIINASVNISTPSILAQLTLPDYKNALSSKALIECVTLSDVCGRVESEIGSDGIIILFHLNTNLIQQLNLRITPESIKQRVELNLKDGNLELDENMLKYTLRKVKESSIFDIERVKCKVMGTRICGINSVKRVLINQKRNGCYELIVEGTGLLDVLGTMGVDPYSTVANNIMEISQVLGIEAARAAIIREIENTVGSHGIRIDHRHVMLLGDTMCFKGKVLGITRFGISKMRASTLMLASFEQTADYLFSAAVSGKREPIAGISESIIMGVPIALGSGLPALLWDDSKHKRID